MSTIHRKSLFSLVVMLICGVSYGQSRIISVHADRQPVAKVLKEIERQSGYNFFYSDKSIDKKQIVSVDATDTDLMSVLSDIFGGSGIKAEIVEKNIILSAAMNPEKEQTGKKQDGVRFYGKVIDSKTGEPVIGASIMIPGTNNGGISDIDGNFDIKVPAGTEVEVSCIGYATKRIRTGNGNSSVVITLDVAEEFLSESVVVGYGSMKKANLSGAVDQVTSEQFINRPVANTTQMLQGAVPNLNIDLADGKPNASASYNIRGTTSIGAGGSALILIDGVEGDPAMINPNDIESVSVLKDAASAAIYGSRAPYGVVLITTKSADKTRDHFSLSYSGNFALQQVTARPDIVDDGYLYASMFHEAWFNHRHSEPTAMNKSQEFSSVWLDEFKQRKLDGNTAETDVNANGKYVYYGNTNYYDAIWKKLVTSQTHNVSASGGTDKLNFYVSGRIYDYDGLFKFTSDTYQTMNLRSKISAQLLDWLNLSENIEYTYDDYFYPMGYTGEAGGVMGRAISDEGHPSAPIFNPDGTLTKSGAYAIGGLVTGNNYMDRITKTFKTTTALKARFLGNKLRFSGDYTFRSRDYTESKKSTAIPYSSAPGVISYLGTQETGEYIKESLQLTNYIAVNAYGEYEDYFGRNYFKALLGYNYEQQTYKSTYSQRYGLLNPYVTSINFALGDDMSISAGGEKWRYAGAFFRFNYGYDDRYLLEVNGRYDGSSKFPTNSQWGFFPSVSAAWRVSKEHWWKVSPNYISNLKFRVSYGELGNSNVSSYSYLEKFSLSTFGTGTGSSARFLDGKSLLRYTSSPSQIPDNIGWEHSRTLDGGLDLGMFKGKLNITADVYARKTLDMYTVGPTLPDTFGASSPKGNYADMSTYGYELSISYNDSFVLAGSPFNYGVKATLADYHSIIDRYNNDSRKLSDYYAGMRVGELWGFRTNGLFQNQAQIDAEFGGAGYKNTLMETSQNKVTYPGDIWFRDLNGNNKIDKGSNTADDPGDMEIIGNTQPRYIYSFMLNGSWRGFSLSAFFQGVGKQDWFPGNECPFWGQYNRPYNNAYKWMIGNYWTEDNPDAYLPRYTGYYQPFYKGSSYPCDRYLQNVAYIRLKNLNIGYDLPKKWIEKLSLSSVNVYFSGENLWTWSPLYKRTKDFDVLSITHKSDKDLSDSRGTGYNYPSMKTFSFGITINY